MSVCRNGKSLKLLQALLWDGLVFLLGHLLFGPVCSWSSGELLLSKCHQLSAGHICFPVYNKSRDTQRMDYAYRHAWCLANIAACIGNTATSDVLSAKCWKLSIELAKLSIELAKRYDTWEALPYDELWVWYFRSCNPSSLYVRRSFALRHHRLQLRNLELKAWNLSRLWSDDVYLLSKCLSLLCESILLHHNNDLLRVCCSYFCPLIIDCNNLPNIGSSEAWEQISNSTNTIYEDVEFVSMDEQEGEDIATAPGCLDSSLQSLNPSERSTNVKNMMR